MTKRIDLTEQGSGAVNRALVKALRPLVRIMLHFDITYPRLIGLLKALYVDIAEQELGTAKRVSGSRITLLPGVHRTDVARLRAERLEADSQQSTAEHASTMNLGTASLGAQIVAEWLANPRYRDSASSAEPAALPLRRHSSDPERASFSDLVESVCRQNLRPRSVLDEWLRLGIVRLQEDQVILNQQAFAPSAGVEEKAYFFGRNIQDHIEAAAANLRGDQPPFFDRGVYYDELSAESIDRLRELSSALGSDALTRINEEAFRLRQRDRDEDKGRQQRFNFGIFNYTTQQSDTRPPSPESEPAAAGEIE